MRGPTRGCLCCGRAYECNLFFNVLTLTVRFFLENSYSRPILDQWSLPNIQSGQLNKWQIWFSGFTRLVRFSGKYPEPRFWTISKTSYSPTWRWMVLKRGLKKYMKTSLKMLAFILLIQFSLIHTSFLLSHSPHSIFSATLFFIS